jgi:hypothetical protein
MECRYRYSGIAAQVYRKLLRSRAGKLAPLGFSIQGENIGLFSDMQKMCLYKPEIFAWNGTLPSKTEHCVTG